MHLHIVTFGLFMAFVDNNKYCQPITLPFLISRAVTTVCALYHPSAISVKAHKYGS